MYNSPETKKLSNDQQRLVGLYYTNFVREGAQLNETNKAEVGIINQKLAGFFSTFSQNLLAEENNQYVELATESDLMVCLLNSKMLR